MSYENTLKALRARLTESATGMKMSEPTSESLQSFIPSRQQSQMPVETTEDIMTKGANWLSEIKKASYEYKKAYEELRSKKPAESPIASAITGVVEKIKENNAEEKTAVAAERRDSFIQRRDENSPSTYAPTRPSEPRVPFTGEVNTFKDAIDKTEGGGGYDTLFSFSERDGGKFAGTRISEMTIGEIKNFAAPSGEYGQWVKGKVGRVATPMGRYQFVGTTLKNLAAEMGLDDNTVFSPEVQDQMFDYYLNQRIKRGKTMGEKVSQVRQAWEGFKHIPTSTLQTLIQNHERA